MSRSDAIVLLSRTARPDLADGQDVLGRQSLANWGTVIVLFRGLVQRVDLRERG